MIAWLVVLMASIRPTVRRVTETLATPARANINATPHRRAVLILLEPISLPTAVDPI
jgi:hypothetical protein